MIDPLKIADFAPNRDRQKLLREQEVLDQVAELILNQSLRNLRI